MGKLFDEMCATGETREQWLNREITVPKGALSSPEYSLPKAWRKRQTGVVEKDILSAFVKRLSREGFAHVRIQVQGVIQRKQDGSACMRASTMTGVPDVIAMKNGQFYMFEVKCPGGKVSAAQVGRMKEWQKQGAICYIVVDAAGEPTDQFVEGIEVMA
jgi:Holliday junction resolvase